MRQQPDLHLHGRSSPDVRPPLLASLALEIDWSHTTKPGQHLKYTIFSNNNQAPFPNWRFSLRLDAMPIVTVVTSLATPQLRRWPVSKNAV